jgi:asparagine N-glycosylation enzyme membrane subunit Stt3
LPASLGSAAIGLSLLAISGLAFYLRALGFEWVFVGDEVVFPPADAQYHLRRAFFSFVNFPSVLLFDHYINFPDGAAVPWPPLFDFVVGGGARLLARNQRGFEIVVAWVPPLFGALTTIPIFRLGRLIHSPGAGLLAAAIFALIPITVNYSRVGNLDHHCAVGLLGAVYLYICLRATIEGHEGRFSYGLCWGLALVRLALILTWSGSLLYVVVADGLLLLAAALGGKLELAKIQSVSAGLSALCLVPILWTFPTPLGGPYSAIALSWLHFLTTLVICLIAGVSVLINRRDLGLSRYSRVLWLASAGLLFVVALFALPDTRHGLLLAFDFISMNDGVGRVTGEQSPIFNLGGRTPGSSAVEVWAYFAYLIPLAPLSALWFARRVGRSDRLFSAALILAAWGIVFGAMAIWQRRYGYDYAPAAAVLMALLLILVAGKLAAFLPWPSLRQAFTGVVASVLFLGLIWPAIAGFHLPRAMASHAAFSSSEAPSTRIRSSVAITLSRFSEEIRRVTPETGNFLDPDAIPFYGILAHPNLGHAIQYKAQRPTATDPFWSSLGQKNWDLSLAFQATRNERDALRLATALSGRYVMTTLGAAKGSVVEYLHEHDGIATKERNRFERFRLISEARIGGRSIGAIFSPEQRSSIPYKLFEIVEGALLEVVAAPGEEGEVVTVTVEILTTQYREFTYKAVALVGNDGKAHFRLPYSNSQVAPSSPTGPYRVRIRDRVYEISIPDLAVLKGLRVKLNESHRKD